MVIWAEVLPLGIFLAIVLFIFELVFNLVEECSSLKPPSKSSLFTRLFHFMNIAQTIEISKLKDEITTSIIKESEAELFKKMPLNLKWAI